MSSRQLILLVVSVLLVPACSGNINHTRDPVPLVTSRVSVSSTGGQADGPSSFRPAISADGRFVAFSSQSTNLVPGYSALGFSDIYVHDRQTGSTVLASVSSAGVQGNGNSINPSISGDGRFVAFESDATNLLGPGGDVNGVTDVFLRDLSMGITSIVSKAGATAGDLPSTNASISADGHRVAFLSRSTTLGGPAPGGFANVYLWDQNGGAPTITRVTLGTGAVATNGDSFDPSISSDGGFVAYWSGATNLPVGAYTSSGGEVFLWALNPGGAPKTTWISVPFSGIAPNGFSSVPSVSEGGLWVAFESTASNLVSLDTNGAVSDIFVRDVTLGSTVLVSRNSDGFQGTMDSNRAVISSDGTRIAFDSIATNLVADDTNNARDVFVHDRLSGQTVRFSVRTYGGQTPDLQDSSSPAISGDGQTVAFTSAASNLVVDDTNGVNDIFVRGP
jgi:Tol biopolymer transport system component